MQQPNKHQDVFFDAWIHVLWQNQLIEKVVFFIDKTAQPRQPDCPDHRFSLGNNDVFKIETNQPSRVNKEPKEAQRDPRGAKRDTRRAKICSFP